MSVTVHERYTLCKLGLFETYWILRVRHVKLSDESFEHWVTVYKRIADV